MKTYLIKNVSLVNEGEIKIVDVLIKNQRIDKIGNFLEDATAEEIKGDGKFLFPGVIDDQVHFREPGLTHKGTIYTEAKAAVAGGITSYMEMPNTIPNVFTQELLEDKYQIAKQTSLANYSFFMGASNSNLDEVLKTNPKNICGVKIFMGSSTGNMLVDDEKTLDNIFRNSPTLIATHCEDETTIQQNIEKFTAQFGEKLKAKHHPLIRNTEACFLSSSKAVQLAKKHHTRLHILHISTEKELALFEIKPLQEKRITAEACIHHLWFSDVDYAEKGNFIKWNPAIKSSTDRDAILQAVLDGRIDVIATDHAPHTLDEKEQNYSKAPSGGPLVQHSLVAMLDFYHAEKITLTQIAEKMAHHVAICFKIKERGFIREGYYADLTLVDLNKPNKVSKENIIYKCGWSPFENHTFKSTVVATWVNGHLAFHDGKFDESMQGHRMEFDR